MKTLLKDYWKVSAFYLVIIGGMFCLNARFEELNEKVAEESIVIVDNVN